MPDITAKGLQSEQVDKVLLIARYLNAVVDAYQNPGSVHFEGVLTQSRLDLTKTGCCSNVVILNLPGTIVLQIKDYGA